MKTTSKIALTALLISGLGLAGAASAQAGGRGRGGCTQDGPGACDQDGGPGACGHRGGRRGHRGRGPGRHHGPGMHHRGGPGHLLGMMRGLDLTEAQEIALVKARRQLRAGRMPKQQLRQANANELLKQLKSGAPSKQALYAAADQRAERRTAREHARIDAFLSVYETLTPAQKQQLAAQLEARMARRQAAMNGNRRRTDASPLPTESY